jgi:hypothetical protein
MKIARIIDVGYNSARWRDPVLKWRLGPGVLSIDVTQPWTHAFAMEAYIGFAGMPDGWTTDVRIISNLSQPGWKSLIEEAVEDNVDMFVSAFASLGILPPWIWNPLVTANIPAVIAHGFNSAGRLPAPELPTYYDTIYWPSMVAAWPSPGSWVPPPDPPFTSFGPAVEFATDAFTGFSRSQSLAAATMVANMARALDACGGDPLWARAILRATGGEVKNEQRGFGVIRAFQPLATGVPQPTDPASIYTFVPTPPDPPPPPPPPPPPQPQPPTPYLFTYPNLVYT